MTKNQLFKNYPSEEFVIELLNIYGIQDFYDNHYFTKKDLEDLNTIQKLNEFKETLINYYIPCKAKLYLNNINNHKKAITILRQFLKTQNYTLLSKEKYIKGTKYNTYTVISITNNLNIDKNKDRKIVINFE
tara:strand:- start:1766 stop:2161 length:396 start_codon:yes stop_codon:yes gene_type:complete